MVYASCLKHNEFPGIWNSLWIVLGFPVVPSLIVSNSLLPMDSTMSALPVFHHLFAQTHAHWVGDAIQPSSSSVVPFSSSLQSFPSSGSFPMSWLFSSDCQSTGASASASVLPNHGYLSTHNSYVLEEVMELEVPSNHEDCDKFFSLKASIDLSNCQRSRKDGCSQCSWMTLCPSS